MKSRYDRNETMKLIGHSTYSIPELGEQGGQNAIMEIVEAYAADTTSGKIYTNIELLSLLYDIFILGVIHGVRRERRRRHNAC